MICEIRVKHYCKDFTKIENYEKAVSDTNVWDCHHRLELDGITTLSGDELIALGLYYDRPADELIFLSHAEHARIHNIGKKGYKHSDEAKAKIAAAMKGNQHTKGYKHSEDTKSKIANALKGKKLSEERKAKISAARKGKHWRLVDGKREYY